MLWPLILLAVLGAFLAVSRRKVHRAWRLAGGGALVATVLLLAVFRLNTRFDVLGAAATAIVLARWGRRPPGRYLLGLLVAAAYLVGAFVPAPHWSLAL